MVDFTFIVSVIVLLLVAYLVYVLALALDLPEAVALIAAIIVLLGGFVNRGRFVR